MALSSDETVRQIIADTLGRPEADVVDEAVLEEELGCDNIGRIAIVIALEKAFGLALIPNNDWEIWRTVQDVVIYIRERAG